VARSPKASTDTGRLTILIVQMGGLGDVVLVSHLFTSLRAGFPSANLLLACRAPFASISALFPDPPDQVIPLDFSPYDWSAPTGELYAALEPVVAQLEGLRADIVIAAEYQPTWLSWFLAAMVKPQRAIKGTHAERPRDLLPSVLEHFGLERKELEGPKPPRELHELKRYEGVLRYMGIRMAAQRPWQLPDDLKEKARLRLTEFDMEAGRYLLGFPLGVASTPVKRWPKAAFLETLERLREESSTAVLFIGDSSEEVELRSIASELRVETGPVAMFAGQPGDLPESVALIASAKAYLGNDTGPMHIASAFRVGGVAVFGGGHWPAYAPWGGDSIAVVHPLPCFGCNWDCAFGHGVCVESIPVEPVLSSLRKVLAGGVTEPEIETLATLPASSLDLIRDASRRYREAQTDRGERLHSILELRRHVGMRDEFVESLEQMAAERLKALEAQSEALEQLRRESDRRRDAIHELTGLLEIRDARVEESEKVAEERRAGLDELSSVIQARDARIKDLEQVAAERLEALRSQDKALRDLQNEADLRKVGLDELTAAIQDRESVAAERLSALEEMNRQVAARDKSLLDLDRTATERLEALHTLDDALKQVQAESAKRSAGLEELTAILKIRGERISELETISTERLEALEATSTALGDVQTEADARLRAIEELTIAVADREETIAAVRAESSKRLEALEGLAALLDERDRIVGGLRAESAERLQALEATEAARIAVQQEADARLTAMEELTALLAERDRAAGAARGAVQQEADARLRAMEDLTALLAERNRVIDELRVESAERLQALLATEAARRAVQQEADARLRAMEDLTAFLKERDRVIEALRTESAERLQALLATEAARGALQAESEKLRATQLELEMQMAQLLLENQTIQQRLIDFERENLYNSVVRQTKKYFHRAVQDSPKR